MDNLFTNLTQFKPQDTITPAENFFTEMFTFLLRYCLAQGTKLFPLFLEMFEIELTSDLIKADNVKIETRQAYFTINNKQVYPDIAITAPSRIIFIEVKLESNVNTYLIDHIEADRETINQIQMYQRIDSFKPKEIYLLTKYFCDTNFDNCPDFKGKRRWREVYELLNKYKSKDLVEAFLVKEIVGFMEVKNMATPKVSYELMKGMEALRSLLSQIEIALEGIPYKKSFGYEWMGYWLVHEDKKLGWIGTYADGNKLTFQFSEKNAVKEVEQKHSEDFEWNHTKKHFETYFDFEKNYYFCLSADEQVRKLKEWIDLNYRKLLDYSGARK